jgi:hypothetical protein
MRVVFAGTPEPALPALEAVAGSHHELVGVVTRPDAPSGRGRRMTLHPFRSGHFLGSGQADQVLEEAGLDGKSQFQAIRRYLEGA